MYAVRVAWAALISTLLFAPPAPREASTVQQDRASLAGGWLLVSPLGGSLPGPGSGPDTALHHRFVAGGYRWGFSAGAVFEPREHLMIGLAGALDHAIWIFDERAGDELCFHGDCYGWTERGLGHLLRLGPELREGYGERRWMIWALAGAHVGLSQIRLDCDNSLDEHCDRRSTDLGPGVGGGVGVALRPRPRFAVGLESGIDHTWLERRDDPFRAIRTWDLALFLAVKF